MATDFKIARCDLNAAVEADDRGWGGIATSWHGRASCNASREIDRQLRAEMARRGLPLAPVSPEQRMHADDLDATLALLLDLAAKPKAE